MKPPRHLLNRTLTVWRRSWTSDGMGGRTEEWVQIGSEPARIAQPSAAERIVAAQAGAALTTPVYLMPEASVTRGDQLREGTRVWEVHATYGPSDDVYLRADCQEIQPEAG